MNKQENSTEKLIEIIGQRDRKITELEQTIQWLMAQINLAKKDKYGTSSEKINYLQLSLFNKEQSNYSTASAKPELYEVKGHLRKRTRLTTDKLPPDLPVEIVEHKISKEDCACPDCGNALHAMGKETRDELKLIPAKAVLKRHVRYVYSCRKCESDAESVPVLKADIPEPVIKGGFASPDTVAHIAVQKFIMASPLYRQEQEWKQHGIFLSRQTMSNWLIKSCEDWLEPIYEEMKIRLCEHKYLHADESHLQVLKEPGKRAQSKSYMWLYRTSGEAKNQIVLYEYQPDRRYIHPERFLKNFKGYLHADGYDGYHKLPESIIVVGCFAHLRRKFFDALKTLPKDKQPESNAQKGVDYCSSLFKYEQQFASLDKDKRFKERQRLSKPMLDEFYIWIESLSPLPQSLLGKAVYYAKSQRKYIERYLLDGSLEISNNRAERSVKPYVIGRKNWIFMNTPKGAKASAIYYSIVITAVENGLNPFEYLTWIFSNAPNLGKKGYVNSFQDFLPGSDCIPLNVYTPESQRSKINNNVWEENKIG